MCIKMEEEKQLKSLKSNLKGLVLSEKNGYTTKRLCEHYREFIGQDLVKEIKKLGFKTISSFLNSLDDIMKRGYNQDGEEVYRGVADDSTRHMVNLISKTPVKKKMQPSGRGGIRGRKSFAHFGRGGRMEIQGRTNDPDHQQRKMRTQGRTKQHYVPKSLPGVKCFLGNVPVNKLNILKKDAEVDSGDDWPTMVKRIGQLLEGKSWSYSSIIDKQYEKKYREQLPSSWWETMEGVRAEPFNAGSGIMIIFPESSLDKSETNNSDGNKIPVVDSSAVVMSSATVPDKQPSHDTPINPEEDQTEDDSNKRLQQAQAQVDEVIDIMEVNVEMIFERNKLSELDQRADNLQEGASQFQTRAINPKRKYWWKNITFMIVIGVIIFGVVVPVILIIITSNAVNGSGDSVTTNVPTMATSAVTEE